MSEGRERGLPSELSALVSRAAGSRALSRAERLAVARELAGHFEDGLAAGRSVEELRARFGDAELAAALIGRVRSGRRRRVLRVAARSAALCAGLVLVLYAGSAAWLRAARPERPSSGGMVEALASVADAERAARVHVTAFRRALAVGDDVAAGRAAAAAVLAAEALSRRPDAYARVAAAALAAEVAAAADGGAGARVETGLAELRARVWPADVEAFAAWVDGYLSRVYSGSGGDGRLTAEGLRVVRALKGSRQAPAGAVLLEPIYFARPASESEVRAEAARLLELARAVAAADAEVEALESRLRALSSGGPAGLSGARYYPLTLALARLPAALGAAR